MRWRRTRKPARRLQVPEVALELEAASLLLPFDALVDGPLEGQTSLVAESSASPKPVSTATSSAMLSPLSAR
ncbi:MAG TPA: hypothetical protein DCY40_04035 [Actinobacteria bacterium]|nr:hypothetical protein [Actinomycetota bacterium]